MKNISLAIFLVFSSVTAYAKSLTVSCEGPESSLELVSEIANVTKAPKIISLEVNGEEVTARNVSKLPVYKEGVFTLEIQYGSRFFSSTKISAEKCNDSFESKGKAVLEEYVGGFAGTKQSRLICTCELL